jgi:hypothetical protein
MDNNSIDIYSSLTVELTSTPPRKNTLTDKKEKYATYAKAWLRILKVRTKWGVKNPKHSVVQGDFAFCTAYNERQVKIDAWVYDAIENISRGTLARKRGILSKKSARGLIPQHPSGRPLLIDSNYPEIRQFMDKCMQADPYICCGKLISLIQNQFSEEKRPSAATIRRYFDRKFLGL